MAEAKPGVLTVRDRLAGVVFSVSVPCRDPRALARSASGLAAGARARARPTGGGARLAGGRG